MTEPTPRLRLFAGPNGSGKSVLKEYLPASLLGVYVNPDEIERSLTLLGHLNLKPYQVRPSQKSLTQFLRQSPLLTSHDADLKLQNGTVQLETAKPNPYLASVLAAFLRNELLRSRASLTLETVMSSPDKVDLLRQAQSLGYRTYLYYIATADPEINVARVKYRVSQGGHNVPEDKIRSRYHRSLDLLYDALLHTNRAYIFDNSQEGGDQTFIAEVTDGKTVAIRASSVPAWFRHAVLEKAESA